VTFEIALLLAMIVLAVVLFSVELVPADVVGLGLLLALMLTGLLPPERAFAGFGSDTVIMILGLLIMTAALLKAGVVDIVGRFILRRVGRNVNVLLLAILLTVALLSAFISNTAAAAFFVPVTIGIAARANIAPSRLLMPVAFGAILTSSVSLISTSTNMVVSGLMTNAGLQPMGMFELAPVGIPIAVVGLTYTFIASLYWIPNRTAPGELIEEFGIRSYLTEVLVLPKSALAGKSLADSGLGADLDLTVVRVVRNKDRYLLPRRNLTIEAGDVLLVEGPRAEVLKVKDTAGIEIRPDVKLSDPNLRSEDAALVEALVVPGSPLIGTTLRALKFRDRYGLQVLGLNRHGKNVLEKLSRIPFRVGDVLLIQGRKTNISAPKDDGMFSILGEIGEKRPDRLRALRTGLIFCGALLLGTFKVVSLPVAMLIGAFGVFVTKCVTPTDAYREVEWRAVILIATMLALGEAMTATGTAKYLAQLVANGTAGLDPIWLLGGVFLLTVALTQPMSNQAAAAVIRPPPPPPAQHMDLNPRAFAMMIAVAASCSYVTPLEPACLMVYGPGRYRFSDFLKVGTPLVVLLFALALWLVPKYWPLVLPAAP
jgi:di/tricarboxylate transporter